jgi:hypothetical protein
MLPLPLKKRHRTKINCNNLCCFIFKNPFKAPGLKGVFVYIWVNLHTNMIFTNYRINSIIVIYLFIQAFIFGRASVYLRHTDYRILYHISWSGCYLLHFLSIFLSLVNLFYILIGINSKEYIKYIWLLVSCIPIYFCADLILNTFG